MTVGRGKYDNFATLVREGSEAAAVMVAVIDGKLGSGFSIQHDGSISTLELAETLRHVVAALEAEAGKGN